MQCYTLTAFKTLISLLPSLLEVFREEGLWELIFSENFFYFGPTVEVDADDCLAKDYTEIFCSSVNTSNVRANDYEILQVEVISFVEFAATSSGIAHNLVCYICFSKFWSHTSKHIILLPSLLLI